MKIHPSGLKKHVKRIGKSAQGRLSSPSQWNAENIPSKVPHCFTGCSSVRSNKTKMETETVGLGSVAVNVHGVPAVANEIRQIQAETQPHLAGLRQPPSQQR